MLLFVDEIRNMGVGVTRDIEKIQYNIASLNHDFDEFVSRAKPGAHPMAMSLAGQFIFICQMHSSLKTGQMLLIPSELSIENHPDPFLDVFGSNPKWLVQINDLIQRAKNQSVGELDRYELCDDHLLFLNISGRL